jgi:opacity protein-like surface antigen
MLALSLATAGVAAAATTPEFKPVPTKKKFAESGGEVVMKYATTELVCTKTSAAGELTGSKTVGALVLKLTGCEVIGSGGSGSNCKLNSTNTKTVGEILTTTLSGELGTVKTTEAASGVGLLLKPVEGERWATVAENSCGSGGKLTGSLAGEVPVLGKKQLTNKLVFGAPSGKQSIKDITLDSGKLAEPELSYGEWGNTLTFVATDELAFEEALEVT